MGDGFHHAASGAGGKLGVSIQRDYVGDGLRKAAFSQNIEGRLSAKVSAELFQLPSLALEPDPTPFALRPGAGPVEEKEPVARVSRVQVVNAVERHLQHCGVARSDGAFEIGEVRKEAEPKVVLLIGEEPDFQFLDLAPDHVHAG